VRFIKLAIISVILIFLLFTAISLFIPSHIRISKATDISNTKEAVMDYISNPVKWKEWYPGADSLPLFFVDGKTKGIMLDSITKAALTITEKNDSSVIATNTGPGVKRQLVTGWKIIPGQNENMVTVQWYMDFKFRWYPWEKFSSLFYENIYGTEMEKGLANLKRVAESGRSSLN